MSENKLTSARLYVVASPIGCLSDWSFRAVALLKQVDLILAEDTRHSKVLLDHYHINTPLKSLHRFNEKKQAQACIDELKQGKSLAMMSDAGTPLISDPGHGLVSLCHQHGIAVVPIPGPCALVAALSASGMGADGFVFLGFLPTKSAARRSCFERYQGVGQCLVFYEAPHRIDACIEDALSIFGDNHTVCIARELTKRYETVKKGTLGELLVWMREDAWRSKGEFVVMLDPVIVSNPDLSEARRIWKILRASLSHKDASRATSAITGVPKNTIYAWGDN